MYPLFYIFTLFPYRIKMFLEIKTISFGKAIGMNLKEIGKE